MITVYLAGGLGNQMFQYAAAYALARRRHTRLQLNLSEFGRYELRSYMLDRYHLPADILVNYNGSVWDKMAARLPVPGHYQEPHYHIDPAFFTLKDGARLHGYFQSEHYFKEFADDLRDQFTPKNPVQDTRTQEAINQANVPVSVHMRRGDYASDAKTQQIHGCASQAYYARAMSLMQNLHGDAVTFFIFSDDPDYAQSAFSHFPGKHIVRGNPDDPHDDMQLMARCHHHVIANSSFSWWGAWLNPRTDKTVIAPRQWFAPETMRYKNTADLFPERWITL